MRLNAAGQVTYGVGAGVVSVNQTAIGQGGSAAWQTLSKVAYGRTVNGKEVAVSLYDTVTKQTTDIASMPGGASQVAAGGGLTARYLADGKTGTTDTNGFKCSTCGLHDVGSDGVLYFKPGARGITARTLAGINTVVSSTAQVLSLRGAAGGCVWVEGDLKARTWKLPAVNTGDLKCYSPRAAQINGEWWLAYGDGTRILAQPFAEPVGYVVADLGNTFDLDCVAKPGVTSVLRVAYATTQGEQTGQYRVVDVDISLPRVPLTSTPNPPDPPDPRPARATILSYQTPIKVSETSKAVARVTQGTPTAFRWQWKDGADEWATAAENPATDRDHHYAFPRVGEFPIRLQTLVDGEVTDQSSSSSRVVAVTADNPPDPPDPPVDPPVDPPIGARRGIVHGVNYCVVDDVGPWLPWGTSLFWQLYGHVFEPERSAEHRRFVRSEGGDFVRVICTGLRKGTIERSLSPKDPRFEDAIAGLSDANWALGLRTQWTIFGAVYDAPSVAERQRAVDRVCAALTGRESAIWAIEIANEGWTNGFEGDAGAKELRDLAARVRSRLPHTLVATTCPKVADDVTSEGIRPYYLNTACTVQTHHYARSTKAPDGIWRPTKKPWREQNFKVAGCCALVQNNEPRGPESSGTETNDPRVLSIDAVTSWLSGVGSYVLHTGAGIYGLADPERGRPANLWDTENIRVIFGSLRMLQSILPDTLPNFAKHSSNGSTAPFHFEDVPQEQFAQAYSASSGTHVGAVIVQPVCGIVRNTTFTLRTGTCNGKVYHPVTGQVLESFTKSFHVSPSQPAIVMVATRTS